TREGSQVSQTETALRALTESRAPEEVVLSLAHRNVARIVEDEDLDGELVEHESLELLHVHLDASVSRQADHTSTRWARRVAGSRTRRPNRRREVVAHAGGTGIHDHLLALLQSQGLEGSHARRSVREDEQVGRLELVGQ